MAVRKATVGGYAERPGQNIHHIQAARATQNWIERSKPFQTVREELQTLASQAAHFHRLLAPKNDDIIAPLARFLDVFDIGTAFPLLLVVLDANPSRTDVEDYATIIESYFLRRATAAFQQKTTTASSPGQSRRSKREKEDLKTWPGTFKALRRETVEWPTNEAFREAWETRHAYQTLNNARMVHVLRRLSHSYLGPKHEDITINGPGSPN